MSKKENASNEKKWEEVLEKSSEPEVETEHPQIPNPSRAEFEEQLTAAELKAQENWDKFMRCQAEMANLVNRSKRDVEEAHKFGLRKFITEILPVLDNLERSLDVKADESSAFQHLRTGVELTLKIFQTTLEKFGVQTINPMGQAFDPTYQEAMSTQVNPDVAPDTVIQVLQKGYLLHERLVRPALVIVAK